jgi:sialic acid synthase SpsE/spore coat polysaccharide biosynthesis protein SpsF (cytidylyltransferase family)
MVRAIIQVRMNSHRLKGKSLMYIKDKPLLQNVIETAKRASFINEIMIATSTLEIDDPIKVLGEQNKCEVFRGHPENVLKRFVAASKDMKKDDTIVRITGDNPFNWTALSQKIYKIYEDGNKDYACVDGTSKVVYEFIRVKALRNISKSKKLSSYDTENVTSYFRDNTDKYSLEIFPKDFGGLRKELDKYLTLDSIDDLIRMKSFFSDIKVEKNKDLIPHLYDWLDQNEKNNIGKKLNIPPVNLGGVLVGEHCPPFVIAEIGQNHNGNIQIAKELIKIAKESGANAVKFQKRDIKTELSRDAYNAKYDNINSFGITYGEHREYLELNEDQHSDLQNFATKQGITYFCTPCDIPSVEMLERLNVPFYKVASRDLTNIPLLIAMGRLGKPVIISTGMASYVEIDDAIKALDLPSNKIIIMQCTSEYPCKVENVNLKVIKSLKEKYGVVVGFSDHTSGIIISAAATLMGASIIEKHITTNRALKGTDQSGSLEPSGLKKLIEYIQSIEIAKGSSKKEFVKDVLFAKNKLSRSLTSKINISKGTYLTEKMICLKSPGTGIPWNQKHLILGLKTKLDIKKDSTLLIDFFK